jgi:hypothetical protein
MEMMEMPNKLGESLFIGVLLLLLLKLIPVAGQKHFLPLCSTSL